MEVGIRLADCRMFPRKIPMALILRFYQTFNDTALHVTFSAVEWRLWRQADLFNVPLWNGFTRRRTSTAVYVPFSAWIESQGSSGQPLKNGKPGGAAAAYFIGVVTAA